MTAGPLSVPKSGWKRGEAAPWWAPGNVRKPTKPWHWAKRWAWLYGYPLTAAGLEDIYGDNPISEEELWERVLHPSYEESSNAD